MGLLSTDERMGLTSPPEPTLRSALPRRSPHLPGRAHFSPSRTQLCLRVAVKQLSSLQAFLLNPWEEDVGHMPVIVIAKASQTGFPSRRLSFSGTSGSPFKRDTHHLRLERNSAVGVSMAAKNHRCCKVTFQFKLVNPRVKAWSVSSGLSVPRRVLPTELTRNTRSLRDDDGVSSFCCQYFSTVCTQLIVF